MLLALRFKPSMLFLKGHLYYRSLSSLQQLIFYAQCDITDLLMNMQILISI